MLKTISNTLRDAKITYKLLFIFAILFYLLLNSWFFSFTTTKDVEKNFKNLENYTLPSLLVINDLKDNLNASLLFVYDYISTGNKNSKQQYQEIFYDITDNSIKLFETSQTQEELEFATKFIQEQTNDIRNTSDNIINNYENNPDNPNIERDLEALGQLHTEFKMFLETEATEAVKSQVQDASLAIEKQANKITYYLILVISVIIIVIILLIFFITNNISKPVNILTKAAEEFGKGKFVEVKLKRRDELGLFAQTFNKMATDISATHNALEEELEKTKELDKQKSEFLSIAAHQLRTPMSGIKWMLKMLTEGDLGELTDEQKHHLQNGLENSERMIGLINSLLDVAKIQQQKFQYKFKKNDINEILRLILDTLKNTIKEKNINIKIDIQKNFPLIIVDKEKMGIALANLIENSIKYSPVKNTVKIKAETNKDQIIISVSDSGYGIPQNQQKQVFTKFFRGSNILKIETEYKTIGTGLGLYISQDIVKKHDGELTFESKENKGSTFYIKLPLKPKLEISPENNERDNNQQKKTENLTPEEIEKIKAKYKKK